VVCRPAQLCLRTLIAAVVCALFLQTFIAVFETALAFGLATGSESFAICHGDGSTAPASGDKDQAPPCSLCTFATAGALPLAPIAIIAARLSSTEVADCRDRSAIVTPAPARAGLSRAPPLRG
jgi:hypothetical protein